MSKAKLLIGLFLLVTWSLTSQFTTVDGYNYYDINHSAFTVDASCFNIDDASEKELEYWFTCFDIAEKVTNVFSQGDDSNQAIVGDYIIVKDHYTNQEFGNEPYRWILMRPNDSV